MFPTPIIPNSLFLALRLLFSSLLPMENSLFVYHCYFKFIQTRINASHLMNNFIRCICDIDKNTFYRRLPLHLSGLLFSLCLCSGDTYLTKRETALYSCLEWNRNELDVNRILFGDLLTVRQNGTNARAFVMLSNRIVTIDTFLLPYGAER